jgi:hypothetical protein
MEILEITENIWTLKYKLINNLWSSYIMVTQRFICGLKSFFVGFWAPKCAVRARNPACLYKKREEKNNNNSWLISSLNFQ